MKISRMCAHVATLGPIGYLQASGTIATLVTLPFVYWLQDIFDPTSYLAVVTITFFLSIIIINKALIHFKRHDDPAEVILDEVVGCLVTFWGIAFSVQSVMVGFILFRFLDIVKIGGIKHVENFVNAWGIMLDDIAAAVAVNLILRLLF